MPIRPTQAVVLVLALSAVPACGSSDEDGSTSDAVDATTCAELRATYEISTVTDGDAVLIADRLVEIAEADYAEDGVLDDFDCNLVILDLDRTHPSAFEGIDLEEIDLYDGNARNG